MKFKIPFKRNNQLKMLRAIAATFAILDEFAKRGIIHYHTTVPAGSPAGKKQGSLLIEESLAVLKLSEGADGFMHFLEQVAQWQTYKLIQEAYEAHRIDVEAKAVREAKKKYAILSKADIDRIRQHARDTMDPIDNLPNDSSWVSEFDIFIIRASAPSTEEALKDAQEDVSSGLLLALGHWDGKNIEMAMYDDIKHNLKSE